MSCIVSLNLFSYHFCLDWVISSTYLIQSNRSLILPNYLLFVRIFGSLYAFIATLLLLATWLTGKCSSLMSNSSILRFYYKLMGLGYESNTPLFCRNAIASCYCYSSCSLLYRSCSSTIISSPCSSASASAESALSQVTSKLLYSAMASESQLTTCEIWGHSITSSSILGVLLTILLGTETSLIYAVSCKRESELYFTSCFAVRLRSALGTPSCCSSPTNGLRRESIWLSEGAGLMEKSIGGDFELWKGLGLISFFELNSFILEKADCLSWLRTISV